MITIFNIEEEKKKKKKKKTRKRSRKIKKKRKRLPEDADLFTTLSSSPPLAKTSSSEPEMK
jgi:hypothetical protein